MPRPMNSPLVYCRLIHLRRQQHAAVRESILAHLRSFAVTIGLSGERIFPAVFHHFLGATAHAEQFPLE